jgi:hypothetical protein
MGHVHKENRKLYRVLEGKSNGRRPLGSPSLMPRCEFNMKIDLTEIAWEGVLIWLRIRKTGGIL